MKAPSDQLPFDGPIGDRIRQIEQGNFEGMEPTARAFSFAYSDDIVRREDLIDNDDVLRVLISSPKTTVERDVLDELGINYFRKLRGIDSQTDVFYVPEGARSIRSVLPIIDRDIESNAGLFIEIGHTLRKLYSKFGALPVSLTLDSFGFDHVKGVYLVPPYEGEQEMTLDMTVDVMKRQVTTTLDRIYSASDADLQNNRAIAAKVSGFIFEGITSDQVE